MAFRTFTVKKWKKLANTANGNPVYSFELESAGHTVKGKTKPNAGFVFGIPSVYPGDKINVELSATPSGRVYMTDFARSNPTTRKTAARTQRAAESYVRRPSQITKKAPSKRLKTRRTVNLQSPRGVFPNPRSREGDYYDEHINEEAVKFGPGKTLRKNPGQRGKKFIFVKKAPTNSPNRFSVVAYFHDTPDGAKDAIEYAKAYHRKQPEYIIKVETGVL